MQIPEPTTLLTDYLLAILTFYFAFKLLRTGRTANQNSVVLWAGAFFATAIAALAGGTSHGFVLYLGDLSKIAIWKITVNAIGLASFFMLAGTIYGSTSGTLRQWLMTMTGLKLIIYAVWMIFHDQFKFVIFDYVPAMIGVILLQIYAFNKNKDKSASWLIAGVLVSFTAAGIQLSGFTIHQHFNHNDLYHVIQMGAVYLLYRGAKLLRDK